MSNYEVLSEVLRVKEICTGNEEVLYAAIQEPPAAKIVAAANIAPDAIVLTNRRAIICRQKVLGRLQFVDSLWLHVDEVHMEENVIGATVSIRGTKKELGQVNYLPKSQARKVYRIAQQMEEEMIGVRRDRSMEETRAGATNVVVNNDIGNDAPATTLPPPPADNDLANLTKLKQMLDAGLIEQAEYDSKKQEILARM